MIKVPVHSDKPLLLYGCNLLSASGIFFLTCVAAGVGGVTAAVGSVGGGAV